MACERRHLAVGIYIVISRAYNDARLVCITNFDGGYVTVPNMIGDNYSSRYAFVGLPTNNQSDAGHLTNEMGPSLLVPPRGMVSMLFDGSHVPM